MALKKVITVSSIEENGVRLGDCIMEVILDMGVKCGFYGNQIKTNCRFLKM